MNSKSSSEPSICVECVMQRVRHSLVKIGGYLFVRHGNGYLEELTPSSGLMPLTAETNKLLDELDPFSR